MKHLVSSAAFLVITFVFVNVLSAQEVPKQISGGVLNGKAITLPKPAFPAAARAVGASGAVSVQVLIDENGDVVSASAVSGHPLLRAAAVEAAQGAKFSPTKLMGNPVKVSGVITYNFVGPLLPAYLAFSISYAERKGKFDGYVNPDYLASQLPKDWVKESEILKTLTYEDSSSKMSMAPDAAAKEAPSKVSSDAPRDTNKYTIKGDMNYSAVTSLSGSLERTLDQHSIESLRTLKELIEVRWSQNDSAAWANDLGTSLGVLAAEIDDQTNLAPNLAKVETLVSNAPSNVSKSSLETVQEFVELCKANGSDSEQKQKLRGSAEAIAKLRF